MSKLNELFVENINKAVIAADVMSDVNQKPMAYASIAHALAVYLSSGNASQGTNATPVKAAVDNTLEELVKENDKVAKAIDKEIAQWTLPYDENGIPFLNEEDFAVPERVLAYQNAMTPEMEAAKAEAEAQAGQAVMNEDANGEESVGFNEQDVAKLEEYKSAFGYEEDPSTLDNMFHNFTTGVISTIGDVTPETIAPFLLFIEEELTKARASLEEWKNSWITEEGLDSLVAGAYEAEGATIAEYIHDGNIFWFLEYVELYNANAWFENYKSDMAKSDLDAYVKQYFDDQTLSIDNIDDSNVIGFIYYLQQCFEQTA